MRVLWVCNVVLPEFCEAFRIRRTVFGGWMEGLLSRIRAQQDCEIALAFPIRDAERRHDGIKDGVRYYAFDASRDSQSQEDADCAAMLADFHRILRAFMPDVVHLWGTEYPHAWAVMEACCTLGMERRVVCHLQGLLSFCHMHFAMGLPESVVMAEDAYGHRIADDIQAFRRQSEREKAIIRRAGFVAGRTFWDETCARVLSPDVAYRFCEEILREPFYDDRHRWQVRTCRRHTIFLSQAGYPIKGFHLVLPAIALLRHFYPDLLVYIGGGNPMQENKEGNRSSYGEYLKEQAEQLDVGDCLHFLGPLSAEEMREQYLRAHVFVSGSTIENSSNSVAEAMMLGTPVVSSLVGGMATLITHGETGLLYQADAPYMLAAYVRQIFASDALAQRLSGQAQLVMRERHEPDAVVQQVLRIYEEAGREGSR